MILSFVYVICILMTIYIHTYICIYIYIIKWFKQTNDDMIKKMISKSKDRREKVAVKICWDHRVWAARPPVPSPHIWRGCYFSLVFWKVWLQTWKVWVPVKYIEFIIVYSDQMVNLNSVDLNSTKQNWKWDFLNRKFTVFIDLSIYFFSHFRLFFFSLRCFLFGIFWRWGSTLRQKKVKLNSKFTPEKLPSNPIPEAGSSSNHDFQGRTYLNFRGVCGKLSKI